MPWRDRAQFQHPIYQSQAWVSTREEVLDALDDDVRRLAEAGYEVALVVRFGDPAQELADLVDEEGVDAVVIATHGRSGLSRAVLGSVAERLLRMVRGAGGHGAPRTTSGSRTRRRWCRSVEAKRGRTTARRGPGVPRSGNDACGPRFRGPQRDASWRPSLEPMVGFEPTTCRLRIGCSTAELHWRTSRRPGAPRRRWWPRADLNCRHHDFQSCALPTELLGRLAERTGFEPATFCVTGRYANRYTTAPRSLRAPSSTIPRRPAPSAEARIPTPGEGCQRAFGSGPRRRAPGTAGPPSRREARQRDRADPGGP
jgi:hypothetical protein